MNRSLLGQWRFAISAIAALAALASAASAAIPVTNTKDDASPGSLRHAIEIAAAGDTIVFEIPTSDPGYDADSGYFTITILGQTAQTMTLVIDKDLTIDGSAQKIVVRRGNAAPPSFRVFDITAGTVVLSRLWISNGNLTDKNVVGLGGGAGIRNVANLTVRDCVFTGNAVEPGGGGGIFNSGMLLVRNSTFSGNTAAGGGGGIENGVSDGARVATVIGCTFNANTGGAGGAIESNGTLMLKSSTIYGNSAISGQVGGGGTFVVGGTAFVQNTIIVGNTSKAGVADADGHFNSGGYNLIGTATTTNDFSGAGDQTGVTAAQVKLAPPGDYGGPTGTLLPLPGSFAIDAGKRSTEANGDPIDTDQRGFPRGVDRPEANAQGGDASDIGAVELGTDQPGPTFIVNTRVEHDDGYCTTDDCSLVEALNLANAVADANTIEFAPNVTGAIRTSTLSPTGLSIAKPVTINGPGARILTITGRLAGRVFRVTSPGVTISGLDIRNGKVTDDNGAAISNSGGLTLNNCTISNSFATFTSNGGLGGGVYNALDASLTVNGCTFDNNTAGRFGGGIHNGGILTATNCTFSDDKAIQGGGIYSEFANSASKVSLRNCTVTRCIASDTGTAGGDGGGGLHFVGNSGQYDIGNTILAGNTATTNPDLRGNFTTDGHNFIGNVDHASGFSNNVNGDQVGTPGQPKDPMLGALADNGGPTDTCELLSGSTARDAGDDAFAPSTDQRGFPRVNIGDIGAFEFGSALPTPTPTPTPTATPDVTPTPTPTATPGQAVNISTRMNVLTDFKVMIGGFFITGADPKTVIIRARGPSLGSEGVQGDLLLDPTLELHQGATVVASNDNWKVKPDGTSQQAEIEATGIPPSDDREAALLVTLDPGPYTAIVAGKDGTTGIGLVEVYDLAAQSDSKLANISTRGFVETGSNVIIGGFIIRPLDAASVKLVIRAIGPSLTSQGVEGALQDPTLELRDVNGGLLAADDNWQDDPGAAEIQSNALAPQDGRESATLQTLAPGSYTAIVRGVSDATGVGLVEVYALQ